MPTNADNRREREGLVLMAQEVHTYKWQKEYLPDNETADRERREALREALNEWHDGPPERAGFDNAVKTLIEAALED
jgi:hypothetical protein